MRRHQTHDGKGVDFPFRDLVDPEERVETNSDGNPVMTLDTLVTNSEGKHIRTIKGVPKLTGATKMENVIFRKDLNQHTKAISIYKQNKEHVFQMLYS